MSKFQKAVRWIRRAIKVARANRDIIKMGVGAVLANNEKAARRFYRLVEKLERVEELHGQHTDFWDLIDRVAESGQPEMLTVQNARYGRYFKRAFNDTVRPVGEKLLGTDVDEVPDLTPDEDDDSNLES